MSSGRTPQQDQVVAQSCVCGKVRVLNPVTFIYSNFRTRSTWAEEGMTLPLPDDCDEGDCGCKDRQRDQLTRVAQEERAIQRRALALSSQ